MYTKKGQATFSVMKLLKTWSVPWLTILDYSDSFVYQGSNDAP